MEIEIQFIGPGELHSLITSRVLMLRCSKENARELKTVAHGHLQLVVRIPRDLAVKNDIVFL